MTLIFFMAFSVANAQDNPKKEIVLPTEVTELANTFENYKIDSESFVPKEIVTKYQKDSRSFVSKEQLDAGKFIE